VQNSHVLVFMNPKKAFIMPRLGKLLFNTTSCYQKDLLNETNSIIFRRKQNFSVLISNMKQIFHFKGSFSCL